jgi:hypothetical protein
MRDLNKTEKLLESLSPKPMQQELKEKIMSNIYHKKRELRILSPAYRIVLAISCVLLFVFVLSEFLIRKSENLFMASLVDRTQTSETESENDLQKLTADLFNIEYGSDLNQWLSWQFKVHRKPAKFKTYQDILNILKEDINGI